MKPLIIYEVQKTNQLTLAKSAFIVNLVDNNRAQN